MSGETAVEKAKKERSPSFPFIPLEKAVERAKALLDQHKREPARVTSVAATWGYGPKSSGLLQTVAALKQYGLVEDLGSGPDRKVQITELARRVLVDARSGAREQALREAALNPRLIAEYATKWVPERPSDGHCISELELDRGFNAAGAKLFLRVFDETVAYASLADNDSLSANLDVGVDRKEDQVEQEQGLSFKMKAVPADAFGRQGNDFSLGTKPFAQRLKVELTAHAMGVSAVLMNADEVDKLIRILEANKPMLSDLVPVTEGAPLPAADLSAFQRKA